MTEEPVEVMDEEPDRFLPVFSMYRDALVAAFRATEETRTGADEFEPFREYASDPVGFAREVLGWEPWQKQREIGEALVQTKRVSVVSCNGAGKTVWAARLLMWFLYTRKNSLVINTAPTFNQVGLLWRQVKQALAEARYELPGRVISGSRLELAPTWYGTGISTDKEERFQGYHPEGSDDDSTDDGGMLVIVDEASGVPDYVFDAMRGYLTQAKCYVLMVGNGNKASGAFFDSHQKGPWSRFNISAYDVPEHILDPAWIEEQRLHWGEDSPQFMVRVLGQFPASGSDFQLFPRWLLENAKDSVPEDDSLHMGVDIARGSADLNVAVVTRGGVVIDARSWHEKDLMRTVQHVEQLQAQHQIPEGCIHLDVCGIGAGVVDRLREKGVGVDGVDFGAKAEGDYRWLLGSEFKAVNRKAELHWAGRALLQKGYAAIPEQYETTLWKQLQWPSYAINERGAISVEAKERLRARHGESPDFADAWILSLSRASARSRIFVI